MFTPKLRKIYMDCQKQGKEFEVVFCSCDNSETEFQEYFSAMPWKAIPFESAKREELMQKFDVQGIPTLLLMDEASGVYKMNGREAITNANDYPWKN